MAIHYSIRIKGGFCRK